MTASPRLVFACSLLTALLAAISGGLACAGGLLPALDSLTHFAPFGLAGGMLALLGGLTIRSVKAKLMTSAPAAVGVLLWGALIAPGLAAQVFSPSASPGAEVVKIVQFNLWAKDASHLRQKTQWLLSQNADFILLQEASGAGGQILEELAPVYPYRATCEVRPHPCPVVLLSRTTAVREGKLSGKPDLPNTVWASFEGALGEVTIVATHVDWPTPDGRQQAELGHLARQVEALGPEALILAGDFNSTPWSFALRRFERESSLSRRTKAQPSWPAWSLTRFGFRVPPVFPIDHVYAGKAWRTIKVERGPPLGSDHYPIIATLTRG